MFNTKTKANTKTKPKVLMLMTNEQGPHYVLHYIKVSIRLLFYLVAAYFCWGLPKTPYKEVPCKYSESTHVSTFFAWVIAFSVSHTLLQKIVFTQQLSSMCLCCLFLSSLRFAWKQLQFSSDRKLQLLIYLPRQGITIKLKTSRRILFNVWSHNPFSLTACCYSNDTYLEKKIAAWQNNPSLLLEEKIIYKEGSSHMI